MIVRILSEGQFRVDDRCMAQLNDLDNQLVSVFAHGAEGQAHGLLHEMHNLVQTEGEELSATELVSSDLVLPDPEANISELKKLFVGEGMIAG